MFVLYNYFIIHVILAIIDIDFDNVFYGLRILLPRFIGYALN